MKTIFTLIAIAVLLGIFYQAQITLIDYLFDHYRMQCERIPGKLDCRLVKTDL